METIQTLNALVADLKATAVAEKAERDAAKALEVQAREALQAQLQAATTKIGSLEAEVTLLKNKGEASQAELDALALGISEAKTLVQEIEPTAPQVPAVE